MLHYTDLDRISVVDDLVPPLVIILFSAIFIAVMIYFIRRENQKRWRKQDHGYYKWQFENYSLRQACKIIDDMMSKREYKGAQRFIHEIMKVHPIEPGTYAWYYYKYNYALSKIGRYRGKRKYRYKIEEAREILKQLQYDQFVISDNEAIVKVREAYEDIRDDMKDRS